MERTTASPPARYPSYNPDSCRPIGLCEKTFRSSLVTVGGVRRPIGLYKGSSPYCMSKENHIWFLANHARPHPAPKRGARMIDSTCSTTSQNGCSQKDHLLNCACTAKDSFKDSFSLYEGILEKIRCRSPIARGSIVSLYHKKDTSYKIREYSN